MDILFLSPADWTGPRGRFQHIALHLARNNRLMYADGLGVRPVSRRDWRRSSSKVADWFRPGASRPVTNTDVQRITPLAIPVQGSSPVRRINHSLLYRFISRHLQKSDFRDPLVWIAYPHPDLVAILDRFAPHAVIYDCVDDWPAFQRAYANLAATEERLARRADIVFATATSLQEKLSRWNRHCFVIPNGVDVETFATVRPEPDDVKTIPRPRIGFVGNIAEWVDVDLVHGLADSHREWHFVFVGDYLADRPRPTSDNMHWLGYRPYEKVPDYVQSFDACIIPFHDNQLTQSVDPLKLYEYLAAGKPVISTPLPRSSEFSDVVAVAQGTDEFAAAINGALHDDDDLRQRRIAVVRAHSWNERVKSIVDLVRKHLAVELS